MVLGGQERLRWLSGSSSEVCFVPGRKGRGHLGIAVGAGMGSAVSVQVPAVTLRYVVELFWFPDGEIWDQPPPIPFPADELVEIIRQFSQRLLGYLLFPFQFYICSVTDLEFATILFRRRN